MILVIDDLRILNISGKIQYARSVNAALEALIEVGKWEEVYLDHDLGTSGDIWPIIAYMEFRKTSDPIKIGKIFIITANPVGAQRMKVALDKMGYTVTIMDPKPILGGVLDW